VTPSNLLKIVSRAGGFACALVAALTPRLALADDSDVVARMGGADIKAAEVRAFVDGLDERQKAAVYGNPKLLAQVVRQMLADRVVLKDALSKKWDQQPAVAAQLARVRDAAIADSYLASITAPPDNYPSDAELQAAYDANQGSFVAPRQFQLAQIFVAKPRAGDKAAEAAAQAKLDRVKTQLRRKPADFASIAKTESDEPNSAKNGGELGWLYETQITPDIRQLVLGIAKGAIADPVQLDDGWHIVKLLDTKPAQARPLSEVRPQLIQQMRAERAQENRRGYVAKLLDQNSVAINELALDKIGQSKK
jgi:parvulin-like peptidyl-prolyl isomerase